MKKQKPKSIRALHEEISSLKGSLAAASERERRANISLMESRKEIDEQKKAITMLDRDKQWFKQLAQQLSEGMCAYMRSR